MVYVFDLAPELLAESIKGHLTVTAFAHHSGDAAMHIGNSFSGDTSLIVKAIYVLSEDPRQQAFLV